MAGPGRDVDALAMTRAVKARSTGWTLRSMFSASKVVLAGGLAALIVAYLVIGGRPLEPVEELVPAASASPSASYSASPSPPATVLPGLVTETVEPGVLRIIRDDAGHDLDARYPDWRYDLDDMTITPDGTVWLGSTYHDSDNGVGFPQAPLVWALGRPGVLGVADGIPPSVGSLVPLSDSSVLAIGDEIVRVDGTSVIPDDGPAVRPVHGGELWLIGPEALAQMSGGDTPDGRLAMIWTAGPGFRWTRWAAPPPRRPLGARRPSKAWPATDATTSRAPVSTRSPLRLTVRSGRSVASRARAAACIGSSPR